MPVFASTLLFSRTDATSNVIVATYGAFAGKPDVGVAAAPPWPREEGIATAMNAAAMSRG